MASTLLKIIPLIFFLKVLEISLEYDLQCDLLNQDFGKAENFVRCRGEISNTIQLRKILRNITDNINTFELFDVDIDALPEDIFLNINSTSLQRIIIAQSSIELLKKPDSEASLFKSVENTLESFEVYSSSPVFAWNMSELSTLQMLETLIIEDSEYVSAYNPFEKLPNLRFVQFINTSIRWLNPIVFRSLNKLTICSLSNNLIAEVTRSMFPEPALHLWSLDLSYNKLKYLPADMFIGMPSLKELKLDNNKLKVIRSLNAVWSLLSLIWLDGNEEICWETCWISRRKHSPKFLDAPKCLYKGHYILLDSFSKYC